MARLRAARTGSNGPADEPISASDRGRPPLNRRRQSNRGSPKALPHPSPIDAGFSGARVDRGPAVARPTRPPPPPASSRHLAGAPPEVPSLRSHLGHLRVRADALLGNGTGQLVRASSSRPASVSLQHAAALVW